MGAFVPCRDLQLGSLRECRSQISLFRVERLCSTALCGWPHGSRVRPHLFGRTSRRPRRGCRPMGARRGRRRPNPPADRTPADRSSEYHSVRGMRREDISARLRGPAGGPGRDSSRRNSLWHVPGSGVRRRCCEFAWRPANASSCLRIALERAAPSSLTFAQSAHRFHPPIPERSCGTFGTVTRSSARRSCSPSAKAGGRWRVTNFEELGELCA